MSLENPICPICKKETKIKTRWTSDLTDASNTTYICSGDCQIRIIIDIPDLK